MVNRMENEVIVIKQAMKWLIGILLMITVVYGVIFLPEYIADQYDDSYLNSYQLYAQEASAAVNTNLTMREKLKMLCNNNGDGNVINIMVKEGLSDLVKNDENLLTSLQQEIKKLEDRMLIPIISDQIDFEKHYDYARLQAVTLNTSPGKILYVWTICFLSEEAEYYYFWVDADTYQIYAARISNNSAIKDYIGDFSAKWGHGAKKLAYQWSSGYVDYLWAGEPQNQQGKATDKQADIAEIVILEGESFDYGSYDNPDGGGGYQLSARVRGVGNMDCYMYDAGDYYDVENENIAAISQYDGYNISHFYFFLEDFILMDEKSYMGY